MSVVKAKSRIYEKVKKGGKITLVRLMFRVQRGHFLSIFFFLCTDVHLNKRIGATQN